MTNERKAELFDRAIEIILSHLIYADKLEYEETLEKIGYTDDEIEEFFNDEEVE